MRRFFPLLLLLIAAFLACGALPTAALGAETADATTEEHDLSLKPLVRFEVRGVAMPNAMIFFVCWIIWAIQANGVGGFLMHIFGPKGQSKGLMKVAMVGVFFAVGILEVVSILFRPISLSFRLFGNVYAGETILESMSHMVPALAWLIPIPFYFMELLVGLVQAMVFMLLTAVFTVLMCQHEETTPAAAAATSAAAQD